MGSGNMARPDGHTDSGGPRAGSAGSDAFVRELQKELKEGRADLRERVKELNCLFTVQRALRRPDGEWEDALQELTDALPPAFRFPDLMGARVTVEGRSFTTRATGSDVRNRGRDRPSSGEPVAQDPGQNTGRSSSKGGGSGSHVLRQTVEMAGHASGQVEVYFRATPPEGSGDPFLVEEKQLLEAVADRLAEALRRRRAESDLRQAESFQRAIISAAPLALFSLDSQGTVLTWNPAAERIFGWSTQEVVGRSLPIVPDDRQDEFTLLRTRVAAGESFSGVRLVRQRRDGTPIHLRLSVAPVLDESGEVSAIMAAAEDITEQQDAWERIRFQADLLGAVGQAVVATDPEGTITYWNRAAEGLYGRAASQVVGRNLDEIVPSEARVRRSPEVVDRLELGRSWTGEFELSRENGAAVQGLVTESPIRDEEGRLVGIIGVSSDISELKELEARFRHSQKMEAVGRLAGGVAHDFNNLLTVIQGHCHLVLESLPEDSGARGDIEAMMDEVRRATRLTRQLLSLSRPRSVEARVLDVRAIVTEMQPMLRRLIPSRIDLRSEVDPNPVPVHADPSGIEQIILNLAVNAADAIPKSGTITFRLDRRVIGHKAPEVRQSSLEPGHYACLTVDDTGHGMTPEVMERIFEPFFSTKSAGEGTGLGLSTVFGIVRESGGCVRVESEPDAGTVFRVVLPLAEGSDEGMDEPGALDPPEARGDPVEESERRGATILVVDDSGSVREVARRALERAGHTVLVASHGREALELALSHRDEVDLVVSDVVMPGIGGADLLERLRELRPDLKIILISGHSEREIPQGVRRRASIFLSKPFGPEALLAVVRDTLAR